MSVLSGYMNADNVVNVSQSIDTFMEMLGSGDESAYLKDYLLRV
jgi:hypothetical protein